MVRRGTGSGNNLNAHDMPYIRAAELHTLLPGLENINVVIIVGLHLLQKHGTTISCLCSGA